MHVQVNLQNKQIVQYVSFSYTPQKIEYTFCYGLTTSNTLYAKCT